MGKKEKSETTFTRYEFEKQLNCLKEFLKKESNYRTDYLMLGCSFLNMIGVCYILQYILNN